MYPGPGDNQVGVSPVDAGSQGLARHCQALNMFLGSMGVMNGVLGVPLSDLSGPQNYGVTLVPGSPVLTRQEKQY